MGNSAGDYVEKVLDVESIKTYVILAHIVIFLPLIYLFLSQIYTLGVIAYIKTWNLLHIIAFPFIYLLLVFLHEFFHALGFWLFGSVPWRKIKIGVFWQPFIIPYTHCPVAVRPVVYGTVLLLPMLVLGIIPFIVSIAIISPALYFYGSLMILAGLADFLIFLQVRKVPPGLLVKDHEKKVGFVVLTKAEEEIGLV